jgi:hypothetical protein
MKRADVSGPGDSNTVELRLKHAAIGQSLVEILCFPDVVSYPVPVRQAMTENVDPRPLLVSSADWI